MYFASVARMSSTCLSEGLAPLALMDCQALSNAAIKMRTAPGSNTPASRWWRRKRRTHLSGVGEAMLLLFLTFDECFTFPRGPTPS